MKTRLIEQFADSPRRVRIMFRIAVIILLVAGCYNWMIKPQAGYLFAAEQCQKWDKKKSDELKRIRLSILELKNKISEAEAQSEQFNKVLFDPGAARDFFCGLEALAQQSGCRVESFIFDKFDGRQTAKQSKDSDVEVVQASVTAIGGYNGFIQFFEKISHVPQKISVQEMRFEPLVQNQSELRCNAVLKVYIINQTTESKD